MTREPERDDPSLRIEWERGTCPRCGSGALVHHLRGMPLAGYFSSAPPWVDWLGCAGFGPDRECLTCEHLWDSWTVGSAEPEEPFLDADGEEISVPAAPLRMVAAVIADGDRLLVLRLAGGLDGWEFPGGEIAVEETPQEALARALRESFAMDAEVGWLIGRVERADGERKVDVDHYWARLAGPLPSAPEGGEWAWIERADLAPRDPEDALDPVRWKLHLGAEPIFPR